MKKKAVDLNKNMFRFQNIAIKCTTHSDWVWVRSLFGIPEPDYHLKGARYLYPNHSVTEGITDGLRPPKTATIVEAYDFIKANPKK